VTGLQLIVLAIAIAALGVVICWAAERADGRAPMPQPMFQRFAPRRPRRRTRTAVRAVLNFALIAACGAWAAHALTH